MTGSKDRHSATVVFACLNSRKTQDFENVNTLASLPEKGAFHARFTRCARFGRMPKQGNSDEFKWRQEFEQACVEETPRSAWVPPNVRKNIPAL